MPDPRDPLTFTRPGDGPAKLIRPRVMYTDGGSVPRIAQVFTGLNPWGYAPAYMIHDWIFTAHHCIIDGEGNEQYDEIADVNFEHSDIILGEAIQGLVEAKLVKRDDVAASAITSAVGSSIAKNMWEVEGACARDKVSDTHLAQIELAIPGSTELFTTRHGRTPKEVQKIAPSAKPARLLSTLTF